MILLLMLKSWQMKRFEELRENVVFNKKIGRVPVKIIKKGNKFETHIDGDKLDSYASKAEAEKMAKEFVKQYKG